MELLALARERSDKRVAGSATGALLKRYQSRIFQWCMAHVGDRELALDMAQEVLISVYRNLDSFEKRSHFSSWIFAIARNQCLSRLRRPALLTDEGNLTQQLADPDTPPDLAYEAREEEERWREFLRGVLEPDEQEAIWLRCFECMPVDEITVVLGLTGATGARGVLQSARRKLRAALERERGRKGGEA